MPNADVVISGNATAPPELKYLGDSGTPVAEFTVASTNRIKNAAGEWSDGDTTFLRVKCFRELAEGATDAIDKGSRVIVKGRLKQRNYEKDGQKRSVFELEADEVGLSVRRKPKQQNSWASEQIEAPF